MDGRITKRCLDLPWKSLLKSINIKTLSINKNLLVRKQYCREPLLYDFSTEKAPKCPEKPVTNGRKPNKIISLIYLTNP